MKETEVVVGERSVLHVMVPRQEGAQELVFEVFEAGVRVGDDFFVRRHVGGQLDAVQLQPERFY